MYNASERKDIRAAEKAAKLAEIQRTDFIKASMATEGGRHWFYDLLVRCHIFASTFTGEALSSANAEGERNIGLMIYTDIMRACPDLFIRMMQEANERELINGRRTAKSSGDPDDEYTGIEDANG
jgi:hypothetical protein